jgi:hypothetical protein
MAKIQKAGRNDLCPCGSGKKYKKCCEIRQERSRFSIILIILIAGAVLGGLAFSLTSFGDEGSSTPAAGRTWSPEHGHWH